MLENDFINLDEYEQVKIMLNYIIKIHNIITTSRNNNFNMKVVELETFKDYVSKIERQLKQTLNLFKDKTISLHSIMVNKHAKSGKYR